MVESQGKGTSQMQHKELYQHILGLQSPWSVSEVKLDMESQEIRVRDAKRATCFFNDWYQRVIHTKLEPMKNLARTLNERLSNIVTFCTQWITNGVARGINSAIMSMKRRAGGYRNIENFKKAIFFYCGGLDLYPR
jgi:transposase